MTSPLAHLPIASEADFFAIPEDDRFHELLGGEIVQKASPAFRHGAAQGNIFSLLVSPFRRGGGPGGGWRFATEREIRLAPDTIVRPDVAGWRRERLPAPPRQGPVEVAPDWTCEILIRANAVRDLWDKMQLYHQAGVPHYWVIDPDRQTLRVHRWTPQGYHAVLSAGAADTVRAEPFEALALPVAELFDEG